MNVNIHGIPVTFSHCERKSRDATKAALEAQLADVGDLKIRNVTVTMYDASIVRYRLEDMGVTVELYRLPRLTDLRQLIAKYRRQIETHETQRDRPHVIDHADAVVARRLGIAHALRQISRTDTGLMTITASATGTSVTPGLQLVRSGMTTVFLRGGKASVSHTIDDQQWESGSLIVGRGLVLPGAVVAAMPGRPLDEIVAGTMLEGEGMVIRKAWNTGKRLGLSFERRSMDIHEAIATMRPERMAA